MRPSNIERPAERCYEPVIPACTPGPPRVVFRAPGGRGGHRTQRATEHGRPPPSALLLIGAASDINQRATRLITVLGRHVYWERAGLATSISLATMFHSGRWHISYSCAAADCGSRLRHLGGRRRSPRPASSLQGAQPPVQYSCATAGPTVITRAGRAWKRQERKKKTHLKKHARFRILTE